MRSEKKLSDKAYNEEQARVSAWLKEMNIIVAEGKKILRKEKNATI